MQISGAEIPLDNDSDEHILSPNQTRGNKTSNTHNVVNSFFTR